MSSGKRSGRTRRDAGVDVAPDAWIAPSAVVSGRVAIGSRASVWHGCVLRGDLEPIEVGEETNVQDLAVVHVDRGFPARVGGRVTVGHRAIVHGCTVEDDAVVGMGAILLTGCRVGRGALVAAGAVVREGFEVPPGAIAAGVPAKIVGRVGDELAERFRTGVTTYVALATEMRGEP
ncbi:MAG TPA: gamma carbonic anhydrase family protein [Candidatus Sulfotelmatobacter sp.]|jgi:carbonic anhydrase/acetyltransferase-like protein (isoleucine patch superfamily)|nr:gamma carbonic anhydrase family protein [Candidatus Sulfotelmatobacter sp.]